MNSHSMFTDAVGWAMLVSLTVGTGLAVWGLGRVYTSYKLLRWPLILAVLVIGAWLGYNLLRTHSGYLAALVFGQDIFLMLMLLLVSGVMAAVPRTRSNGRLGMIAALLMLAGFYAVYLGGSYLGLHAWRNDHAVPLR